MRSPAIKGLQFGKCGATVTHLAGRLSVTVWTTVRTAAVKVLMPLPSKMMSTSLLFLVSHRQLMVPFPAMWRFTGFIHSISLESQLTPAFPPRPWCKTFCTAWGHVRVSLPVMHLCRSLNELHHFLILSTILRETSRLNRLCSISWPCHPITMGLWVWQLMMQWWVSLWWCNDWNLGPDVSGWYTGVWGMDTDVGSKMVFCGGA